jgi:hypothetical protein
VLAPDLDEILTSDPDDAADWLAGAAGNLAFGDVVAAQAVFDLHKNTGRISFNLIRDLIMRPPEAKSATLGPNAVTLCNNELTPVRALIKQHLGEEKDGTDIVFEGELIENLHPWLILAHLAYRRAMVDFGNGEQRLDVAILLTIGKSPLILRQPGGDDQFWFPQHQLASGETIACHRAGIVEAATLLILRFITHEPLEDARKFVTEALAEETLPMLARLDIVLQLVAEGHDRQRVTWARGILDAEIAPKRKYLGH